VKFLAKKPDFVITLFEVIAYSMYGNERVAQRGTESKLKPTKVWGARNIQAKKENFPKKMAKRKKGNRNENL